MRYTKALRPLALAASLLGAAAAQATGAAEETALDSWRADPAAILQAADVSLDDFKWIARPIVVFADTPADPAFQRQMRFLLERVDEMVERDVVIIVDTEPEARSELRRALRPRGFTLTLIGKDGRVKLRKPFPWDVREISRSIDKMPMRRQELRDAGE